MSESQNKPLSESVRELEERMLAFTDVCRAPSQLEVGRRMQKLSDDFTVKLRAIIEKYDTDVSALEKEGAPIFLEDFVEIQKSIDALKERVRMKVRLLTNRRNLLDLFLKNGLQKQVSIKEMEAVLFRPYDVLTPLKLQQILSSARAFMATTDFELKTHRTYNPAKGKVPLITHVSLELRRKEETAE